MSRSGARGQTEPVTDATPADPPPVALLVGVSGGIGAAIAQALVATGMRVFGTSRAGTSTGETRLTPVALDVTDAASVAAGVERVVGEAGRLDVVVHNAGTTLFGALEETTPDEAGRMLDTNLLGTHRVVRAAMPHLRASRGRIVITGSIAGFLAKPYEAWYSVVKHGLDAYAEALRVEMAPFGVRVTLLEPGFIRTDLSQHAVTVSEPEAIYDRARSAAVEGLARDLSRGVSPDRVGAAVVKVLSAEKPPLRVLVGPDAHALNVVKRLLPDRLFLRGMSARFRAAPDR